MTATIPPRLRPSPPTILFSLSSSLSRLPQKRSPPSRVNYANVDPIVELVESAGVDAVRAGWGHASENPCLPNCLAEKGIVFIGPLGNTMRALGNKISSNVPTMGWSGDGPITDACNANGKIDVPEDLYLEACVTDVEQAIEVADRVGYPLMYCFPKHNPRLQVEYPTTEMVSAASVPAAQLQVAMGIPLHRIPRIQRKPTPTGHVIACRTTAENPDAGFKPSAGHLVELNFCLAVRVFTYGHDRHSSRRNMIMTPKELRIRGDFRTTVEYLITLLETDEFASDHFSTEWLDARIQQKLTNTATAKRPDRWVLVVTGAATTTYLAAEDQKTQFLKSLGKGQDQFSTSFILDGVRYDIAVTLAARDLLVLRLNDSHVVVRARALPDGSVLVTYTQKSYAGDRLSINGRTAVLDQKTEPTQLRSPSPGKLVRWLIPDAGHVDAGQAFAKIEVMRMIMLLVATNAGTLAPGRKQPGSPIAAGEILVVLELDDVSQVKPAEVCAEPFLFLIARSTSSVSFLLAATAASAASAVVVGKANKAHQGHLDLQQVLDQAVDGFEKLPFLHTAQVLGSYHGRLPNGLEDKLLDLVSPASPASTDTPLPAAELLALLATIFDQAAIAPILEVVRKYEAGADAHAIAKLNRLKTVLELRTRMEPEALYWTCFSRSRAAWNGKAIGAVLNLVAAQRSVLARSPNVQKLCTALHQLAELGSAPAVSVAAKTKGAQSLPGFDERYRQFCDVTRAVAGLLEASPAAHEEAMNLINSPFLIFGVLPSLFYENDVPTVDRLIALDMYWHLQFSAYDLGIGNASAAAAGGSAYDNPRTASVSDMTLMIKRGDLGPVRVGVMAAVRDAAELQQHLPAILALFPQVVAKKLGRTEPWHALNVAVEVPAANAEDDEAHGADAGAPLSLLFGSLLASSTAVLRSRGIRHVTMIVYRKGQYPRYFTFRERLAFGEDATIRNIEPSHAFQLELYRLARFNVVSFATPTNRRIHAYHAVGKDNALDSRFFVRALVRPGRLTPGAGQRSTVEYLTAETDEIFADGLNAHEIALELVTKQFTRGNRTSCGPPATSSTPSSSSSERTAPCARPPAPIGSNTCGMVAWPIEMKTPECPRGRSMVLIANDITFVIGSFAPQGEDVVAAASKLSRELGVPHIYVSASSGACIGLANKVLAAYRIAWIDPCYPALGFKYLYLMPEDRKRLRDSVTIERVVDNMTGETHMRIVNMIGTKNGLGVKHLMRSGLIASTSAQ
ncbi:acetyl-coenzyme-A carboxylase [Blastocladiella emersonii ATCC 22665]|nr:acetyl-coenzyme-A carboxylase [Blastocladiella emersonii ATCC 22665]